MSAPSSSYLHDVIQDLRAHCILKWLCNSNQELGDGKWGCMLAEHSEMVIQIKYGTWRWELEVRTRMVTSLFERNYQSVPCTVTVIDKQKEST